MTLAEALGLMRNSGATHVEFYADGSVKRLTMAPAFPRVDELTRELSTEEREAMEKDELNELAMWSAGGG